MMMIRTPLVVAVLSASALLRMFGRPLEIRLTLRRFHVHPPVRTGAATTSQQQRVAKPDEASQVADHSRQERSSRPAPARADVPATPPAVSPEAHSDRESEDVVTDSYSERVNGRNTGPQVPVYANSDAGKHPRSEEVSVEMSTSTMERSIELPVRPGEEPWTVDEVKSVREELNDELTRLDDELDEMEAELQDLLSEAVVEAGDDDADSGSKSFERDHEIALANSLRGMRDQVEAAIERLDSGAFGICKSCEEPIGKLRLQAFPQAQLCLACKQREERR